MPHVLRSTILYWTSPAPREPHVPAALLVEGPEGVWIEPLPGAPVGHWWSTRGVVGKGHPFLRCHSVPRSSLTDELWWCRLEYLTEQNMSEAMLGRTFCGGIKSHPGWTGSAEALALALVAEQVRYHPERAYAP